MPRRRQRNAIWCSLINGLGYSTRCVGKATSRERARQLLDAALPQVFANDPVQFNMPWNDSSSWSERHYRTESRAFQGYVILERDDEYGADGFTVDLSPVPAPTPAPVAQPQPARVLDSPYLNEYTNTQDYVNGRADPPENWRDYIPNCSGNTCIGCRRYQELYPERARERGYVAP